LLRLGSRLLRKSVGGVFAIREAYLAGNDKADVERCPFSLMTGCGLACGTARLGAPGLGG
jgi:hypothetical protein